MRPVPILIYHSVSDEPEPWIRPFAISPATFRRQLALIGEVGATAVSLRAFVAALGTGEGLPERPVVITFDDGLADFREQALPALEEAGCPATLFVTTGFLEGLAEGRGVVRPQGRWLAGSDLADLHGRGVEIGAHSHSHPELDTLRRGVARAEIVESREILEQLLGARVESFAYPHGYHSPALRAVVEECGFASACAVRNMLSSARDERFSLARLMLRADTPLPELRRWLEGDGAPVAPQRESVKTRGWRTFRRSRAALRRHPAPRWE